MKNLILILSIMLPTLSYAQDNSVFVGFGEVPVLSGSFKPSLGIAKRHGLFEFGGYYQFSDSLERDGESFNADFGQNGLSSSSESVGQRGMLQMKFFPWNRFVYLTLAAAYNDNDSEKMHFETTSRIIGANQYMTDLDVNITRNQAIRPAIGFGFAVPITKVLRFSADFTMDWFTGVPTPDTSVRSSMQLQDSDRIKLIENINRNFNNNFHNRHHLFNMGLSYLF
ncbi:MAG: hypothetical protein OEM38_09600 [Gammaproteobacteria bacterium]|nr:hypothetical protein [Gammaproteobacteria bacterium]